MIRAIRPAAVAQDDASMIVGWNIAPNVAYTVTLLPGASACGVLLYDEEGSTLIASGSALAGSAQPCILSPQSEQAISMVDADLGWHILLTTAGTESQRTIRIGPMVDIPDEIHPVYGDDDMALARATAAIDAATHCPEDVTTTCPNGVGAGIRDVIAVPLDGALVVGQVESLTWVGSPDGSSDQAVIRRHIAIEPDAFVEPTQPIVANDTGETNSVTITSGNVLENDGEGLAVVAVNGLSAYVGAAVAGDNGGSFTINTDGSWSFDPDGDFGGVPLGGSASTSVMYHASNGEAEASATLTVTVSRYNTAPVAVDDTAETDAATTTSGNVLTNDGDAESDPLVVSAVNGSAGIIGEAVAGSNGGVFVIETDGSWTFDPGADFSSLTGDQTATTSISYTITGGIADESAVLTVTVSASAAPFTPAMITTALWYDAGDSASLTLVDDVVSQIADKSGNDRHLTQATASMRPTPVSEGQNGLDTLSFDGGDRLQLSGVSGIGTGGIHIFQIWRASTSYPTYLRPPLLLDNATLGKPLQRASASASNFLRLGTTPNIDTGVNLRAKTSFCIHLMSAVNNSPRDIEEWFNDVRTYIGTSTNAYDTASQKITLGLGDHTSFIFRGEFCEALVVEGTLSEDIRQKIIGYFAHRWGLTDSLSADHPYKSAAPTI